MSKAKSKVKAVKMWAVPTARGYPDDIMGFEVTRNHQPVYVLDARDYRAMRAELKRLKEFAGCSQHLDSCASANWSDHCDCGKFPPATRSRKDSPSR